MTTVTRYQATDGQDFATRAECAKHEEKLKFFAVLKESLSGYSQELDRQLNFPGFIAGIAPKFAKNRAAFARGSAKYLKAIGTL